MECRQRLAWVSGHFNMRCSGGPDGGLGGALWRFDSPDAAPDKTTPMSVRCDGLVFQSFLASFCLGVGCAAHCLCLKFSSSCGSVHTPLKTCSEG